MAEFPRLFDDEPNQNQPLATGGGLSALTQQTPSIMERVKQMQAEAPPIEPERTLGGTLKDVALSAAKIPIGVGEMAVGLGSLATGGKFGKFMEEQLGYRPDEARQFADQYLSPAQKAANQRVGDAEGFVGKLVEGVKNPSVPFHSAIESMGYMGAGGAIARGIPLLAGKLAGSSALAGKLAQAGTTRGGVAGLSAAGEGLAVAGSQAENIRRQTADKELTPMQQLAAAGTGLIGAGIARGGQAVSDYFKVLDPDLWLAGGSKLALQQGIDTAKPIGRKAAALSLAKSVGDRADKAVKGYISNGVFEEMPQEMFETFMENLALGKPLSEGVGESGALGLLSGGIMGGIAGAAGPSLAKRQKIDEQRGQREAELAELDAAINQARTTETAQKVTPTGQPIPKATETSGPMGRAVNRSALPAPALGLGFNRAQTPPQMDGPIVFADGSTLSPYDFYQQRLEEHGDDALARQETFSALSGQDKAQASGGLLPLLPKDEVVTFNDGSFAKRSEIIDSLMQDGSTQEEAIQIADNLIAASRPQPEPTSYDLADYQAAQAARQLPLDLPTTQPGDTNEKALQTPNAETTETAAGQNAENVNWPQAVELDGIDYQLDGFKDTGEPIYVDPEQLAIMPKEDIERIFTEGNAYADNTGERATPDDTTATGADTGTGSDRRGTERTIGIDERGSLGSGIDATGRTTAGLGPVIDPNASIDRPSLTGTTELEQQPTATTDTPSQPISGTGEPNQSGVGEDGQVASSREAQIKAQEIDLKAQEAATSPINDLPQPTEAQKQAGNYKKGKVKAFGFDISIENPAGSERTGTDTDGETWRTTMSHHYGYIKRSKGADGDQVDVFIGPNADSQTAFVVEQIDPKTGKFDEHKVMLGFDNKADAEAAYRANYADDWQGLDKIIQMPLVSMKKRINEGKFNKPLKGKDVVEHAPDERVAATKDAVTTTPQNPILKQTKKGWVNQQLKSQQIKKTSPGYNEAVQRIEGQYEEELDKALAALPFEEFNNHPLNQNATESINRQAWESLRSAYEITDDANTQTKAQRLEDNQQIQPGQSVQTRPVRAGRGAGDMANHDAQTVTDKTATDPQQAGVVTDAKIADLPSVGTVTEPSTEVGPALREQTTNEIPVSWESPTVEDDNRWFGTRIEKKPQFKKELPIQGTVHRVYKGSSTGIIEFQPDGTDSVFRLRPDQISRVISISDSKQVSEKANDDQNNSGRTSVDADKPKTGRFNANSKHGGVDEQFRMANRGKKIAVLHGLNDKVGAYSREEIEGVAQENIDAVQDYLIKKYNEAKTPKGQPVQPNARADQAGNGQVDQSGAELSEVSSEEAQSQATDAELDKQERTLKRAITKAKNDLKNSKGTLEEKLKLKAKVKQAQDSLRDFRLNYFDNKSKTNDQSQNQTKKAEQQEAKEEVGKDSVSQNTDKPISGSQKAKSEPQKSLEQALADIDGTQDTNSGKEKPAFQKTAEIETENKPVPLTDSKLSTIEEMEERLQSIHKQIQALDDVMNPRDFDKHHAKYKKLVERRDELLTRQNKLKREQQELLEDSAADKIKADKDAAKPEVTQTKQQAKKAEVADEVKTGEAKAIEDFGEKLGGSRKDKAQSQNKISEFSDDEIANLPLSKIWPKESIDKIEDKSLAAIAHAFREVIPTKPQSSYKKRAWVEKVKTMKGFFDSIANSEEGQAITKEKVFKEMGQVATLTPVLHKIKLLENLEREQWGRIGEVRIVRMPYFYNKRVSETGMPGSQVSIDKSVETFLNITDINELAKAVNDAINSNPVDEKGGTLKFEIRTNYHSGVTFINKKGDSEYRHLKEFKSVEDARDYLKNNYVALAKAWEAVKERDNIKKTDVRRKENRPRTAQDWRKGKDVTVEQFQETFGFRGAEFGNWVSQGKNAKERQGMLNFAYDALMDLSSILEIPTQAISLDGSLGIGFGSRGSGAAAAHFEPGRVVINLTKTKGAGALAHEWFHALDNYFSRMRGGEFKSTSGETYRKENFVTYKPERLYVDKEYPTSRFTKKQLDIYAKTRGGRFARPELWIPDPKHKEGVRPVVEKAFADLVNALNESPMAKRALTIDKGKSEGYWSQIIERGARSFENYVIAKMAEQGYHNDYLANVTPYNEFARNPERYPYLLENELKPIVDAFDNLFKTMETRETDKGVALFSKAKKPISSDVTFGEFETGKPVTFDFAHNTESATDLFGKPKKGDRFKRDLEPSGRYVIQVPDASEVDTNKNTISGTLTFNNPLVLNVETWKEDLQRHYKKRGKALSNALIADGFDGVVTIDGKYGTSEILDLTTFDEAKAKYSRSDTSTNTHTAQSLTETIRRVMDKVYSGGWFDRLLSTGKFKVVTSDEAARLTGMGAKFHKAWHGSPHDFDRFTTGAIGTGEGAQAFGYGLYFADKKEVAEHYRDNVTNLVSGNLFTIDDREFNHISDAYKSGVISEAEYRVADENELQESLNTSVTAISGWVDIVAEYSSSSDVVIARSLVEKIKPAAGSENSKLYQVELAPKQEDYLLWDKPLSEQSEKVKSIWNSITPESLGLKVQQTLAGKFELVDSKGIGRSAEYADVDELMDWWSVRPSGQKFYENLISNNLGSDKAASEYLRSIGIRGIKYLDGTSRNKGEGAYNYVIFDESDVSIEAKYSKDGDVLAFYNPADDTTYFVADNISQNASDAEIKGLMLHEVGVHALNLGRDSKEFQAILKQVEALAKTNEAVKQAAARVPADTPAHLRSEETLGYLVEQNPDLPVVKRFLAWLRDTLRKIGMTIKGLERAKWIQWANKLNDADLVYMAQKALRKAADSLAFDGMQTGDAMASTAFDQPLKTKTPLPNGQQTVNVDGIERPALNSEGKPIHPYVEGIENFWRWFGASRVVNEQGRPLVVYHGTDADFSEFSSEAERLPWNKDGVGHYFTSNPEYAVGYGGTLMAAYIRAINPLMSKEFEHTNITVKKAKLIQSNGYDAVYFDGQYENAAGEQVVGPNEIVVFNPNQIKSATGNQGTFASTNADIRYSKAPPQQTPAWRRWFGNSKMVSAGQPITFYHGTNADFTVFDSEKLANSTLHSTAQLGHFFTRKQGEAAQYGSRVHEVFLRIEKPYVVTSELLDKRMGDDPTRFAAKLKADGFDGLWIKDAGYAVVFDSNQVKLTENAAPSFADDIRYSKRANDQTVSQTVTGKPRVTKLKKMVRNLKDKARSNIYSLFGVDQMVDMAKHVLPSLSDYQDLMTQRRTLQSNIMLEADRIVRNKWRTMDGDTQEALAKVMHDSTLNDFDPRLQWSELTDTPDGIEVMTQASLDQQAANKAAFDLGGSKVGFNRYRFPDNDRAEEFYDQLSELAFSDDATRAKEFSRVQAAYRALPEVAKEVFSETEATHEDLYQQKRQALEDRLLMAIADERKRSAYIDMLRLQFESNKMNWYYAPLSRFGDYWFYGTEADGEKVFSTFESVYALNEFRDSFLSEGGAEIGSGKKVQDMLGKNLNFEGVGEGFLADLNALLEDKGLMQADPDLQDEIYQMFLSTLPDVSMRKNSIHRKGVKGFEEDAMRSFAQAIWHGAKQLSNLKYNQDMLRELKRAESAIDLANSPNRLAQAKQDVAALDMLIEEWDTLGQAELEARAVLGFDQELYETALTYRKRYESMDEDAAIAAMRDEVADKQRRIKAAEQLGTDKEDTRFAADILTHLNKSYEDMQNPKFNSWAQFLMTTNFMTMLAFSPSTMIVNTLQTPNVAIPISYGQFGDLGMKEIAKEYTRTSKQFLESLAKDYRDFDNNHSIYGGLQAQHDEALKAGDTKLAERLNDELTAMKHWLLEGDISRTQAYDLIGVAETGYDYGGVGTRVKEIGGGVMHHSERFNREVTLLSNYRLGRRSGLSHNEAFRKARELNDRSHFNYSPENAPIVMRQPWSKLFFQFKKYQQNMLYVWGKSFADWTYGKTPQEIQQGRRTFLALAASQTMFAGALGFPAAGMLLALANMVGGLGGDDDDEPFDAEREIRLGLIDLFKPIMGEDAAKTASYSMTHGLFTGLTPVNISSRLSLRDTLFRDPPREFEGRDAGMYLVASLAGPTAGTIMNLYQGMDYAQEGEWMRAAESVMPKVLRDLLKAARYGTDDAKTLRGNVIKEMKASEVAWQALGFSSSELSKKYDEKKFVMQANTALTEARSKLIAKASEAQLTSDGEGYQQTMNKIRDWNRKHKEWPIKPDNIKQSIRSRQRVEQNMGNTGIYLNPKLDYLRDKFSL